MNTIPTPFIPPHHLTYKEVMDSLGEGIVYKFLIFGIILMVVGIWHMSKFSKRYWIIPLENGDEFDMTENITGFLDMLSLGAGVGAIAYYLISIGVINL